MSLFIQMAGPTDAMFDPLTQEFSPSVNDDNFEKYITTMIDRLQSFDLSEATGEQLSEGLDYETSVD